MTKQAIVEKVKKYLEKRFLIINENAISYSGIREDSPIFNSNERKAMHIVNYAIESVEGNEYTTNIYTITLDAETNEFQYILGKNILEEIDES